MNARAPEQLTDQDLAFLRANTAAHLEVVQQVKLEDYQRRICEAVDRGLAGKGPRRIGIKACHAVGKSFTVAGVVRAMMTSHPDTIVITTAPTHRQVAEILWAEINDGFAKMRKAWRLGRMLKTKWDIGPKWFALGFSPEKKAVSGAGQEGNSLQGFHAPLIVMIFDEATGVPKDLWNQAEGILSTANVLFLCIGNPTTRNSEFFKCFRSSVWAKLSIDCFDSPNLSANGIHNVADLEAELSELAALSEAERFERINAYKTPKPHLISLGWVVEKAAEWGLSHPLFLGKVLGQFPEEDSNTLIPERIVQAALDRQVLPKIEDQAYLGVDVARFGTDKSVITGLLGLKQVGRKVLAKADTNEVVGAIIQFIEGHYGRGMVGRMAIDGGFGQGVIDRLRELQTDPSEDSARARAVLENMAILEVNFGGSDWVFRFYGALDERVARDDHNDRKVAEARENFFNFKAEMFELLRQALRDELDLMDEAIYLEQLPTILANPDSRGRLKIESKEEYKTRTGENSPDDADSLALANYARHFAFRIPFREQLRG